MSGEFRWCNPGYMYNVLENFDDEGCQSEISEALGELYKACAPVERGCAWYEACDSGPAEPILALVQHFDKIQAATRKLEAIRRKYDDIIKAAIREHEKNVGSEKAG